MPLDYADRETTYAMANQFRQLAEALDRLAHEAQEDRPPRRNPLERVVADLAEVVEILEKGERGRSVPAAEIARIGDLFADIGGVLRELGETGSR